VSGGSRLSSALLWSVHHYGIYQAWFVTVMDSGARLRRGSSAAFLDARLDLASSRHINYITIFTVPKKAVARDNDCKKIAKKASEGSVKVSVHPGPRPLRIAVASQQQGWAKIRQAHMGCQEAQNVCSALQAQHQQLTQSPSRSTSWRPIQAAQKGRQCTPL
jgi:hypothetical protein